jgi:hypothetical protein
MRAWPVAAALALLLGLVLLTGEALRTLPAAEAAPKDFDESPCPTTMPSQRGDGRAQLHVKAVMTDNKTKGGSSFDVRDVKRLLISTKWTPPVWSSHTQRLKLYTPGGSFYQQFLAQIGGDKDVQTQVLVAGTWITEFSLYGTWCAQVFLDDEEAPAGEETFVLAPKKK